MSEHTHRAILTSGTPVTVTPDVSGTDTVSLQYIAARNVGTGAVNLLVEHVDGANVYEEYLIPLAEGETAALAFADLHLEPLLTAVDSLYRVSIASFTAGNEVHTRARSTHTLGIATIAPEAPANLVATSDRHDQVDLVWDEVGGLGITYKVYRATISLGPYTLIDTTSFNTFTDDTVAPSTTYYYVVKAVESGLSSGDSNEDDVTTPADTVPAAPVQLDPVPTGTSIILTWEAVDEYDVSHYRVYYGTDDGGPYTQVGGDQFMLTYTIQPLPADTYYIVITAVDLENNESAYSNQKTAVTG